MFRLHPLARSGARRHSWIGVATVAALLAAAAPVQGAPFAYITEHDAKVSQYEVVAGGLLAPMAPPTVATGVAPYGVAVSPDGHSVYVASPGDGSVSQYDVGPDGALSPKSPAKAAADAPYVVTVSPDGQSVYTNNDWPNRYENGHPASSDIWQYDVGAGGELSPKSPATVASGVMPGGLAVSPDSQSVYVPDLFDELESFDVRQYDVGAGGELSPKTPATVDSGGGQPGQVAVSPDGESVYVTNRCATRTNFSCPGEPGSVAQYDVGPDGALSPKSPARVLTDESAGSVAVSPGGESLYVNSNTGWSDESGYVNQYDIGPGGELSSKSPPKVAAGEGATSVTVSPDGESVYVINRYEGTLSQYEVGAGGALSPGTKTTIVSPHDLAEGNWPQAMAVSPAMGPTAKKQCMDGGWKEWGFREKGRCVPFVKRNARHSCFVARKVIGRHAFRKEYGKGKHHRRAWRRCVKQEISGR